MHIVLKPTAPGKFDETKYVFEARGGKLLSISVYSESGVAKVIEDFEKHGAFRKDGDNVTEARHAAIHAASKMPRGRATETPQKHEHFVPAGGEVWGDIPLGPTPCMARMGFLVANRTMRTTEVMEVLGWMHTTAGP